MKITVRQRVINAARQLQPNSLTPPFDGASSFPDRCVVKEPSEQNAPDDPSPCSQKGSFIKHLQGQERGREIKSGGWGGMNQADDENSERKKATGCKLAEVAPRKQNWKPLHTRLKETFWHPR